MKQYTATWQTQPIRLTLPLTRARLREVPFAIWALVLMAAGFGVAMLIGGLPAASNPRAERLASEMRVLQAETRDLRSEIELRDLEIDRLRQIGLFSGTFKIPADRATQIYDIALAEGITPGLAFNLVRVESGFRRTAVSSMGAIGYTQIKPSTARWLEPTIATRDLFDAETNLHLGFRYFRYLLEEYNGDTRLALLAYNRGPGRVGNLLTQGIDPANGYAKAVLGE